MNSREGWRGENQLRVWTLSGKTFSRYRHGEAESVYKEGEIDIRRINAMSRERLRNEKGEQKKGVRDSCK